MNFYRSFFVIYISYANLIVRRFEHFTGSADSCYEMEFVWWTQKACASDKSNRLIHS